MQALVHHRPGSSSWEDLPGPEVGEDDAALAVVKTRRAERRARRRGPQT